MKIEIINNSRHELPKYETIMSAGMDLRANIDESVYIMPGERRLIPTGLKLALPIGYEMQVRPRSGLALKYGITVLNAPGTIDADYRGEIGVILYNAGHRTYRICDGDRIAQAVIAKYEKVEWDLVDTLGETERGEGGFGHSGKE